MHHGVGVHEHELLGIQCGAGAVGAVDHQPKSLQVGHFLVVHQGSSGLGRTTCRLALDGLLPAPANSVQVTRCALPAVRDGDSLTFDQRRITVGGNVAGVADAGTHAVTRATDRWVPSGRATTISAAIIEMRVPGVPPHARTRTGATGIAPRMSSAAARCVAGTVREFLDELGHQRQRRRTVLDFGSPVAAVSSVDSNTWYSPADPAGNRR